MKKQVILRKLFGSFFAPTEDPDKQIEITQEQVQKLFMGILQCYNSLMGLNKKLPEKKVSAGFLNASSNVKISIEGYLGEMIQKGFGIRVNTSLLMNENLEVTRDFGNTLPEPDEIKQFVSSYKRRSNAYLKKFTEYLESQKVEVSKKGQRIIENLALLKQYAAAGDKAMVVGILKNLMQDTRMKFAISTLPLYETGEAMRELAEYNRIYFPEETDYIINKVSSVLEESHVNKIMGFHPWEGTPLPNKWVKCVPNQEYKGELDFDILADELIRSEEPFSNQGTTMEVAPN